MSERSPSLLSVLIVSRNAARAAVLEAGLHEAGSFEIIVLHELHNLMRYIVELDPDAVFIDLENPEADARVQVLQVARCAQRPLAVFVDCADAESIAAAVDAGVGAYVVDGLRRERIKSVLDTAISRFNAFNKLRDELDRAKSALENRKIIERAKGILMQERGGSEDAAYALLRKTAMKQSRRLIEVAQSVVAAKSPERSINNADLS